MLALSFFKRLQPSRIPPMSPRNRLPHTRSPLTFPVSHSIAWPILAMDLSLLLCAPREIHHPPDAIFDAVCTPTYRGCTFQVPTKITYAYSYGAGFIDPQHSQTAFPDVQMISPPEVEVENSDDEKSRLLDPPPSSPRCNHICTEEEPGATGLMPLTPTKLSDDGARPPAEKVPPFLATQPEVPSGGVRTELASPVTDQRYDEDSGCTSQPYIPSLPHVSDDERDDAIVSRQLLSGGGLSPSPPPNAGPILLPDLDGLEEDEVPFQCPGSPSYVSESPTLTPSSGISDVLTEVPTRSLSPSEDHAQFDGDSTQFLKWLDGVVHENGRVPSFINRDRASPGGTGVTFAMARSISSMEGNRSVFRPPLKSSTKASQRRVDATDGPRPRRPTQGGQGPPTYRPSRTSARRYQNPEIPKYKRSPGDGPKIGTAKYCNSQGAGP
ncbi:hypothetical protein FA13DRAFT_30173 [Coprinellus micaceus]|uniref:Uncharacterized protein n=1 Tax=Coprinellus micaceus TaxID=71717 RepID=A0A4Y7U1V4_COPMI|nr:hypothetical protein FA13DRAFT_30173 [Coprinellus micaceus]